MPQVEMPKHVFNNAVRLIKTAPVDRVKQVRMATAAALERLGAKRRLERAVSGLPAGSDTFNVRSLLDWMNAIGPDDRRARRQLIRLDATAFVRIET